MLSSKPTSRSPTAVASGSTRLTAPPIAQPPIWEKGDGDAICDPSTITSMTSSESSGMRCDFQ